MNRLLLVLLLSSLLQSCAAVACRLPENEVPSGATRADFQQGGFANGKAMVYCNNLIAVKMAADGPVVWLTDFFFCDDVTKQLTLGAPSKDPVSATCTNIPDSTLIPNACQVELVDGTTRTNVFTPKPANKLCPANSVMELVDGTQFKNFECGTWTEDASGNWFNTYSIEQLDGTKKDVKIDLNNDGSFKAKCVAAPPTTTVATTTTLKPTNNPPTNPQCFWSLNYYYNYGRILHGFCAPAETQGCAQMFNNGIGYDRSSGSGSLGNTITESCYYQMKTTCSENYSKLRRLHFHRVGNHYVHHLPVTSDGGIFVGYVALQQGHCGARWPVKAWSCAVSEDVMYAGDLEWNTWYKGRAQYGGAPQFWLF